MQQQTKTHQKRNNKCPLHNGLRVGNNRQKFTAVYICQSVIIGTNRRVWREYYSSPPYVRHIPDSNNNNELCYFHSLNQISGFVTVKREYFEGKQTNYLLIS